MRSSPRGREQQQQQQQRGSSGDQPGHHFTGYETDPVFGAAAGSGTGSSWVIPDLGNTGNAGFFEAFIGSSSNPNTGSGCGPTIETVISDDELSDSTSSDESDGPDPKIDLTGIFEKSLEANPADGTSAAMGVMVGQLSILTDQLTKLKKAKGKKKNFEHSQAEKHRLGKIPADSGQHGLPAARS